MAVKKLPLIDAAFAFIKSKEGFAPISKGDYKQASWGYGTKAPGVGMKISEAQAKKDSIEFIKNSLYKITNALNRTISDSAMIALLDFDYNLGFGNTQKLISDINDGNTMVQVANRLALYVNAGGVFNQGLQDRRNAEFDLIVA